MNTYSIGISGSYSVMILAIIIAVIISYFYYRRTVPAISRLVKTLLFLLRSFALSLLLFIIFEPLFTRITGSTEPPAIAVILDNSISAGLKDAKFDRKKIYRNILRKTDLQENFEDIKTIAFDNSFRFIENIAFDSLDFRGQSTNISKALNWVAEDLKSENTAAVVMVTDGVFNTGNNPLYPAEKLAKPVFVIGVGDTSYPKDISVVSLIANEIVHLNSVVPVNVNLQVNGFQGKEVSVFLYEDKKKIAEQKIQIHENNETITLTFEYKANREGIHKITAEAKALDDELTTANNIVSDFIEVTSAKKNIMIIAGAPGPDLSFIKNAIEQSKGAKIKAFVQKKKSAFYGRIPGEADFNAADVIFLIGFPNKYSPDNVLNLLKSSLEKGKSLFLIASADLSWKKLKIIETHLPFTILAANNKEYQAIAKFNEQSLNNPLLRTISGVKNLTEWNELPPLFRTEVFVKSKPRAEIIAKVKVNDIVLNEPLIITSSNDNQKTLAVLGYGIYRWRLLGYAQSQYQGKITEDLFTAFINNSVAWLTSDANKKKVIIKPAKSNFKRNEKIEFIAQVYDAAFNPVDNANVNLKLRDGDNQFELTLYPLGNGQYSGYTENLSEGDYYFSGNASVNGKNLGSDKGRFSVGDVPLEYQNLRMNKSLLSEIAQRTGGKFYFNDNVDELVRDIKKIPQFKPRSKTVKIELPLWNLPVILAVIIFLFAIEWFFRKRFGLL